MDPLQLQPQFDAINRAIRELGDSLSNHRHMGFDQTSKLFKTSLNQATLFNDAVLGDGVNNSGTITLQLAPTKGDCFIKSGTIADGDFANAAAGSGFIFGIDDSDSDLTKFYVGNATNYIKWDGSKLTVVGRFQIGGTIITVTSAADIQSAIDEVSAAGGGTVNLAPGTYNITASITVPSNVTLNGPGAIIDCGGAARQILIQGTDAYSTGTLSVNNDSSTVTGVGTTWTSAMVGRSILIEEFWYVISARNSNTEIVLESPYIGSDVSGVSYVLATTIESVTLSGFTIQNSSIALIKLQYVNGVTVDTVYMYDGLIGLDGDDSAFMNFFNSTADTCGTGVTLNRFMFNTMFNFNILSSTTGGGLICDDVRNTALEIFCCKNNTGDALSLSNCSNMGVEDFAIQETTGIGIKFSSTDTVSIMDGTIQESSSDGIQLTSSSKNDFSGLRISASGGQGIELVSGNDDIQFSNMTVESSTSDGIKLTATSDRINISNCTIINNGGYEINIAASTCNNNTIGENSYGTQTYVGVINDAGTETRLADHSLGLTFNYHYDSFAIVNHWSDIPALVTSSGTDFTVQFFEKNTRQRRTFTTDWADADSFIGSVILGNFIYILLSDNATAPDTKRVYRYARDDMASGGTLMTFAGAVVLVQTDNQPRFFSDGTNFYFSHQAGNTANAHDFAKYTVSGTEFTYVSTVTCGATAADLTGATALANGDFLGLNSSTFVMRRYNSSGTLQATGTAYNGTSIGVNIHFVNSYIYINYNDGVNFKVLSRIAIP